MEQTPLNSNNKNINNTPPVPPVSSGFSVPYSQPLPQPSPSPHSQPSPAPRPGSSSTPPSFPSFSQPIPQPAPSIPEVADNTTKPAINMNTQNSGQKFKLASTEVQGPKPPLVASGGSKFSMIAIALILLALVGFGGYYFYTKDNNSQPVISPVATPAKTTPVVDKNLDSDKDGLPDSIEKVLGTYMTKADTDGDGYNDLQEIKSGYSPLIVGAAGKYSPQEWDLVKGKIKVEDREFYEKEFEAPALSPVMSPVLSSSPSPTPQESLSPSPSATSN